MSEAAAFNTRQIGYLPGVLGFDWVELCNGYAFGRFEIAQQHLAPNGYLHAGSVVALADTACGYGCFMSLPEGASNFTTAELVRDGEPTVLFAGHRLTVPERLIGMRPGLDAYFGRQLILGVRPSDFEDARLAEATWPRIQVTANVTEELGSEVLVLFAIDAPPVRHASLSAVMAGAEEEEAVMPITGDKAMWTARVASRSGIRPGQQPELAVEGRQVPPDRR